MLVCVRVCTRICVFIPPLSVSLSLSLSLFLSLSLSLPCFCWINPWDSWFIPPGVLKLQGKGERERERKNERNFKGHEKGERLGLD